MKVKLFFWVGVLMAVAIGQAHAFACFGTSMMTCNPWQQSVQDDAYFQTGGRAKHKDPATGLIQVFCPVYNTTGQDIFSSDSENTWNDLIVTYKDPDGTGEAYRVTAALRYVDTAGNVQTVASVDSNQQANAPLTDTTMQTLISGHEFDFINRHYYLQVGIEREDTGAAPDVAGFNICGRVL
jgi:hypothetical protein